MNVDAGGDFAQLLIRATKCYKGANHGFDNDTTPRYDRSQRSLAAHVGLVRQAPEGLN